MAAVVEEALERELGEHVIVTGLAVGHRIGDHVVAVFVRVIGLVIIGEFVVVVDRVKVGSVELVIDFRLVRRRFTPQVAVKVDAFEEGMALDFGASTFASAESMFGVRDQTENQIASLF